MIPGTFLTSKPSHMLLFHIRWLLTCLQQESHSRIQSNVGEKNICKQVTVASNGKATIQTEDTNGNDSYYLLSSHYVSGIILVNSHIRTHLILLTTLRGRYYYLNYEDEKINVMW